ncbi:MAG: FadR family transcriptional regulator [Deltaproteobacteria bacterium]|nr:FadR family transcriptional regulator [Deltaproteobacteria bacterium]MBW2355968.1 FadR family transcriptional regulator [Deltaproteobacteria bacterium]
MQTKLVKISAVDAVVNHIKAQIAAGHLPPDAKLPSERELQGQLGVSRFTLREGLARLQALGLLRIEHGRGAFVRPGVSRQSLEDVLSPMFSSRNPRHLADLMRARALIEGEVAAEAAAGRSRADLARLDAHLAEGRRCIDDPPAFGEHDFNFHQAMAGIAQNAFYRLFLEAIAAPVSEFLAAHALSAHNRRAAAESHQAIVEAIHRRQPDLARDLTRRHIDACHINYQKGLTRPTSREAS